MLKISRSGVEAFIKCKRCFVLQYKHKVRAPGLPFTLNIAIDNLCKNEFDHYRELEEPHPIFIEYGIDAIPFSHPDLDTWRNNFKGIRYKNEEHGYNFGGAIDDVWIKPTGELIISDTKATSVNEFKWEDRSHHEYAKGYERQIEMYQWLFRKNGFEVANEGYLIYYNGLKNEPMFNQSLKFELHLIKLECNDDWVGETVRKAVKLLASNSFPEASANCDNCNYFRARRNITQDSTFKS